MHIRSRSVALLRHLARPRAAPSLTTAAATAPPDTTASLHRELKKVKAKVDEFRELYDWFSWGIFPTMVSVLLIGEWDQNTSIKELKKSVAMLKVEKEKAASTMSASSSAMPAASESESEPEMTASSSAMPASEPESEPTVANGTSCVGGST